MDRRAGVPVCRTHVEDGRKGTQPDLGNPVAVNPRFNERFRLRRGGERRRRIHSIYLWPPQVHEWAHPSTKFSYMYMHIPHTHIKK